jgi:pimeloyl-ACP methyl ester carboxylesterase
MTRNAFADAQMASMADLSAVRTQTLVIVGDHEVPYLRIVADALAYGIPGARKAVIPGGGHLINIIEPQRYNRAVLDFLRGR